MMARVFHTQPYHDYNPYHMVGVKRVTNGKQLGMIIVVLPPATEEKLQMAEDACLNDINIATWGMTWR